MEARELAILERIGRNLPITSKLTMLRLPCAHGHVFMGYGTDATGVYHGVWGLRDVARTIQFQPGCSEIAVRRELFSDATQWGDAIAKIGAYDEGWWNGGRVGTQNAR